ncbi:MAG TPA: hypothetical protein VMY37_05860 [Thermoguttaceae bacterium]|nr:hypothetical protein [Thermoguttaceae bacterium]
MRNFIPLAFLLLYPLAALHAAEPFDAANFRAAIDDLQKTFPTEYSRANEFLGRLEELQRRWPQAGANQREAMAQECEKLKREALLANPLVVRQPILFTTRAQYINNHGTEETMYQSNEPPGLCFRGGGALKVLDVASGCLRTILELPQGIVRDPEVHFDGRKILFSMRRDRQDDYHLYEIDADGQNLRQLTFAPRVTDIHPVYLPNGKILFSSTREPKYIPCQRHLMANLFVMEADGANICQVGHNTQFEGRGSLLPDGRVLYTRWEYVDKHFSSAYGLWTANPDGTNQSLFYGGLAWQPGAIVDARAIPDSRHILCVFTSVHDLGWGAMVVINPARGNDGPTTVMRSWPADLGPYLTHWDSPGRVGGAQYDAFMRLPLKYESPYPLSEKYFLVSRMLAPGSREMGLFVVDVFGNEVLLHHESPGCFEPMLLAPRPCPPVIPGQTDSAEEQGTLYVYSVYRGEKMEAVAPGTVKAIRIVEAPAKLSYPPAGHGDWNAPCDGESHTPTAVNWNHYNAKRVLGTVPVEADGSACFNVPAGRFLYFQLLDDRGIMVHSMRSGTMLQPGEQQGCVGCHDYRSAVPGHKMPLALRREPSAIRPWYGPPRDFSYTAEVQPVLDRHCMRCHDYGQETGSVNLSGDLGVVFNASYVALMARSPDVWTPPRPAEPKPLVSSVGAGPVPVVGPYAWGSHRSRLVELLQAGHEEVKLSPEELDRIITWIDLNAPYYPDHVDYYTANTFGRSPLDHAQLLRLGQLVLAAPGGKDLGWNSVTNYTGSPLGRRMAAGELPINFTRPEQSACLKAFPDPADPGYQEALALIRSGQEMLARHPRVDMPGFVPCVVDRQRLDYHAERQRVDERNRRAIRRGTKVYDPGAAAPRAVATQIPVSKQP